ncbi:helix-turn-helix transcriptional regulator [Sphingobium baderi]|uniref:helix-turn-helix transcriptional regulator n=1 Tax=Sphingobium baderi TaxID=1332080 RepID=UPI002B409D45|nr:helix-turn-helix domain-containing protein [Sphingobium baderi]WRD76343.1 helix-turn-helix domain-containing protein [Sphingobium baderi]
MTSEELKARRKGMGYTQDGLARVLGVSRKTINEMENGGPIDKRTELAVLAEGKRVQVLEHTVWVFETNRNSYGVAQRLIREIDNPRAMFYSHGESRLYGEFKRRDHAYRWSAAIQRSDNARETRKLTRERAAEAALREHARD